MGRIGQQIGCVLCSFGLCACALQTTRPVQLPPLDAPRGSFGAGEVGGAGEYRLEPGDQLRVKFLYHPELDLKVPIRPDGSITLQLAGDIHAAGLTPVELENVIKDRTSDRLRDPEISVIVAQIGERKVYVGGEVRAPGFVVFHSGMTPLQAIMDRGGFSDTAREDSVLRLSGAQSDYQGTRLDLTKPLEEGAPQGTQLAAGDVLYVPRSFIGDIDAFVKLYVREVLPTTPRVGAGTSF
jgi:protein involved in polysaccharide export with SLBB domain